MICLYSALIRHAGISAIEKQYYIYIYIYYSAVSSGLVNALDSLFPCLIYHHFNFSKKHKYLASFRR